MNSQPNWDLVSTDGSSKKPFEIISPIRGTSRADVNGEWTAPPEPPEETIQSWIHRFINSTKSLPTQEASIHCHCVDLAELRLTEGHSLGESTTGIYFWFILFLVQTLTVQFSQETFTSLSVERIKGCKNVTLHKSVKMTMNHLWSQTGHSCGHRGPLLEMQKRTHAHTHTLKCNDHKSR